MIRTIARSQLDIEALKQSPPIENNNHNQDYRNKIVIKPWGHEFLIYESKQVAIWFLSIKKKQGTSMHCHTQKETALIVLNGEAICSTRSDSYQVKPMDILVFEPGVFHCTKAIKPLELIEIENPPDKSDLVRIADNYGRKGLGYEGESHMSTDLEKFGYFFCGGGKK